MSYETGNHGGYSVRSYAAHRRGAGLPGGTHAAVKKAISSGRVKSVATIDGHARILDFATADREWAANTTTRPGQAERRTPLVELEALSVFTDQDMGISASGVVVLAVGRHDWDPDDDQCVPMSRETALLLGQRLIEVARAAS